MRVTEQRGAHSSVEQEIFFCITQQCWNFLSCFLELKRSSCNPSVKRKMLFSIIFCEDPSTWGRLSFMCWFIFINWNSFLCVSVSPKVISSKFLVAETARNSKNTWRQNFLLLKHLFQQLKKKLCCWNTVSSKRIFLFFWVKNRVFSCVKTRMLFWSVCDPEAKWSIILCSVLCFWIIRKQSITLCSYFCCFGIYQKILNSGNRGFFHCILFGITKNSRHGIRACPGS